MNLHTKESIKTSNRRILITPGISCSHSRKIGHDEVAVTGDMCNLVIDYVIDCSECTDMDFSVYR